MKIILNFIKIFIKLIALQKQMTDIKIYKYPHCFNIPHYGTKNSSGVDLYAAMENDINIEPNQICLIPTGIAIILPDDIENSRYEAQIRARSGLSLNHGITVLNSPGTIDSDYHEEIKIILINHSKKDFTITRGMKIAQMIIAKCEIINFKIIDDIKNFPQRGGFGSTGI